MRTALENVALRLERVFEASDAQWVYVDVVRAAVEDFFRDEHAGSGRMHYAVTAESAGIYIIRQIGVRAQDGIVVGRDLIQSSPAIVRSQSGLRQHGETPDTSVH